MTGPPFIYQQIKPDPVLRPFVDSFWMLQNPSELAREVVILPDGRIDLFLQQSAIQPFEIILLGLGTKPEPALLAPQARIFAISFNLLATEYMLRQSVAALTDSACIMPSDFWGFSADDLTDFGSFAEKATHHLQTLIPRKVDQRKQTLFEWLYTSQGSLSVKALSERVGWSSRQINRYFNQQYGLSLKAYCNVLRFRASFAHIKGGTLFPEQDFADQAHFIREIRKFAGTIPKKLFRNKDDRFIQFSALSQD